MEIILNRERAMKAVEVARNFAAGASGLRVLRGVFVSAQSGHVRLTTTDLELWCQVEMEAQTPQPGETLLPVRNLATVLKNMPKSRIRLRGMEDGVECLAGSSEVRLAGIDPEEYPDVEPPEGCVLSMPLNAALVDRVAYAASRDETRYTLTGVLLEVEDRQLKLLATDGHRLARFEGNPPPGSECSEEEPVKAVIPVRLLNEGVRLGARLRCPVTLEVYEKAAGIRVNGSILIWSGLIDGQYPAFEQVVPSEYTGTVTVPKGALSSAVARIGALSKGRRNPAVALGVEDSCLVVRLAEDAGDGIAAVERVSPAGIEGTVPACGLRVSYLSEALARLPDVSSVAIRFSDDEGLCPVAIQGPGPTGARLLNVIMPCKLPA